VLPTTRITSVVAAVMAIAALVVVSAAFAAKPAGGKSSRYSGTLTATPNVLHAGDTFTVNGCGYNPADGDVLVTFTGGSWGSKLDSDGCFTIAGIPALSGDTLPAGTYEVRANQYVHGRWTETGDTTVTVVD
jgi:hypothetical protein